MSFEEEISFFSSSENSLKKYMYRDIFSADGSNHDTHYEALNLFGSLHSTRSVVDHLG